MKRKLLAMALALALSLGLSAPALAYRAGGTGTPAVAMSASHTAYIDGDGVLWTWGRGRYGELGRGSQEDSAQPVRVMEEVSAVSVSDGVTAAIKRDGTLWMWGSNYHGQLGNGGGGDLNIHGTSFDRDSDHYIQLTPVQVLEDVAQVHTTGTYTAAIKRDGTLWMWGDNQYGHLGNGGQGDRTDRYHYVYKTTPVQVLEGVSSVVLGEDANAVAVIRTDGSLWMWGDNQFGQLGNGGGGNSRYETDRDDLPPAVTPYQTRPLQILDGVASVSIGANHAAAVKTDGTLWTWGSNAYGQLGNGSTETSYVPVQVLEGVSSASLGWSSTAAVKTDGTLWTWGRNYYGQLGNGSTEDAASPAQVLEGVSAAVWDRNYCMALRTDGSLWAWGWNYNGQLGNGSWENSAVPAQILEAVSAVSGSQTAAAAIRQNGSLWAWGDNYYGQLGNGSTEAATSPVQAAVGTPPAPALPFDDVSAGDWFYAEVGRAYEAGLMNGDGSPTRFNPGGITTRAMLVTILYRLEGQPEAGPPPFPDVAEDQWYASAVSWAAAHGIVGGRGGGFDPAGAITRQDFAAILFRYAGAYKGYDVTARTDLAGFSDAGSTAPYAREALEWAGAAGLVGGSAGMLDPAGSATRAQAAAILVRFCQKFSD